MSLVSPLIVIIPIQPSFVKLDNSLEWITHKEMSPHRIWSPEVSSDWPPWPAQGPPPPTLAT